MTKVKMMTMVALAVLSVVALAVLVDSNTGPEAQEILSVGSDASVYRTTLVPSVYTQGDNEGYWAGGSGGSNTGRTWFKITASSSSPIDTDVRHGVPVFTSVSSIRFDLDHERKHQGDALGNGRYLSSDTAESVSGQRVGRIGTGAMLVQVSDNPNGPWSTQGYYTDVFSSGGSQYFVLKSEDVSAGRYVRVLVAYEIFYKSANIFNGFKSYENEVCLFKFYVGPSVNVLTINNLTLTHGEPPNGESGAENMGDEALSTTGIFVNRNLGRGTGIEVWRNGMALDLSKYHVVDGNVDGYMFKDGGVYDLRLTDSAHNTIERRIYIDTSGPMEAFERYFELKGNVLRINAVDDTVMPVGGAIVNSTTGGEVDVPYGDRSSRQYVLEDGTYRCVFKTGLSKDITSGDRRVWELTFTLADGEVSQSDGPIGTSLYEYPWYEYVADEIVWHVSTTMEGFATAVVLTLVLGTLAMLIAVKGRKAE